MSHKVGQAMSYWILPVSGIVISCTTVQKLTRSEKATDEQKAKLNGLVKLGIYPFQVHVMPDEGLLQNISLGKHPISVSIWTSTLMIGSLTAHTQV